MKGPNWVHKIMLKILTENIVGCLLKGNAI